MPCRSVVLLLALGSAPVMAQASRTPPTISRLSPGTAAAGGPGFILTVTGRDFKGSAVVRWNGVALPTTRFSDSRLQATVTAAAVAQAGTVEVTVFTKGHQGGASSPVTFLVTAAAADPVATNPVATDPVAATPVAATAANPVPALAQVTPSTLLAGGGALRLEIAGAGFVPGATAYWNGAARTTTVASSTRLFATIPAEDLASPGSVAVTVTNPAPGGGTSAAAAVQVVHLAPFIARLTPGTVTAGSGDIGITVEGRNFIPSAEVRWNGAPRPTSFVGQTQVRALLPAADLRSAGAGNVTVATQVGLSIRSSAPSPLTISLPPQEMIVATPQLEITAFYVGGPGNPASVTAGRVLPLAVTSLGVPPTHYRVADNAEFSGAQWTPASGNLTWTFSPATSGSRTLWLQYRYGDGPTATRSQVAQDAVEVVPLALPFSTAGVTPAMIGLAVGERARVECPAGDVMTGVQGLDGLWLDNIGVVCAGTPRGFLFLSVSGGWLAPTPWDYTCPGPYALGAMLARMSAVSGAFLGKPSTSCLPLPAGISRTFDPAGAVAVAGLADDFRDSIRCPDGAFPVGIEGFINRVVLTGQPGISALGLICAKRRE